MSENLAKRKHPRLKEYDYSSDGIYFVTICTQNKKHLLSQIVGRGQARNPQSSLHSLRGTPHAPAVPKVMLHRSHAGGASPSPTKGRANVVLPPSGREVDFCEAKIRREPATIMKFVELPLSLWAARKYQLLNLSRPMAPPPLRGAPSRREPIMFRSFATLSCLPLAE